MIIAISGKIGSGKDTVATMIQYLDVKPEADELGDLLIKVKEIYEQIKM